jgi:hypothetical protein
MNALHEAARDYARRGWPVFPCAPRSKMPCTAHGFKDATNDLNQIRRWWQWTPAANVATPTGVAFDVVDFDQIGLYEEARDSHDLDGPQVRTARGAHFYVALTGVRSTKLTPHIDFQACGGYVLLPPSHHPGGAVYRWIEQGEPRPAPNWLRVLLSDRRNRTASAAGAAKSLRSDPAPVQAREPAEHGIASLRAIAEGLATQVEGNRNAYLYWAARTASDTGISSGEVAIVLRDAALQAGLDECEIERTLASA